MVKKSMICYQCDKNGKIPIYFRDENRAFKVAFYVCNYCMNFSGFINWTTNRAMPYFNDMRGLMKMKLCKSIKTRKSDLDSHKAKVLQMKKDPNLSCFKCKKYDYSKLYIRNRRENTFDFVGYVCKWCRVCYLVNNSDLKFKARENSVEYMGSFATQMGEDEEKPLKNRVTLPPLTVTKAQAKKIIEKYGSEQQKEEFTKLSSRL